MLRGVCEWCFLDLYDGIHIFSPVSELAFYCRIFNDNKIKIKNYIKLGFGIAEFFFRNYKALKETVNDS